MSIRSGLSTVLHFGVTAFATTMLLACIVQRTNAQAVPTATRSFGFAVFGAASEVKPDFGPQRNYGFVLGADATRHTRLVDFTLEPRVGSTSGPTVGLTYFLAALKFEKALGPGGRIHPYFGAGLGYGIFKYESSGFDDNSTVYMVNVGADFDVARNFAIKAEWQYQFWDLGTETDGFNPAGISAGVVYRFYSLPFGHRR
jgi:opacity protein-like surface antigen